jgi:hypothetical protein
VPETPLTIVLAFLAALVGFAAHRASLCTVKAVEEVISTRRGFMLLSFAKTMLWVAGVTFVILWVWPEIAAPRAAWTLTLPALAGGMIFGVGAVFNGGCSISTLTRLGAGNLGILLSLIGFCAGLWMESHLAPGLGWPLRASVPALLSLASAWSKPLLLLVLVWMAFEAVRLVRSRPADQTWRSRLLAQRYRLSTAAMIMGLSNGLLYAIAGAWAYTSTLSGGVRDLAGDQPGPGPLLWLLFLALLAGIVVSAWQSGRFRLDWRPRPMWLGYFLGGGLMGFGAALVPGGNDVLILQAIPSLSPHAVPVFLAMLAGIAMALGLMRMTGMEMPKVDCSGDLCRS